MIICNECNKNLALFECVDCKENFCKACYDDFHAFRKFKNH